MSSTSAPGTAVLLMNGGGVESALRSAQVVGVPPLTRACVKTFVNGGGHPGRFMSGAKNGECIAPASSTGYACRCVLSLIPADWNPAVIELPIETYRSNRGSIGMKLVGRNSSSWWQAETPNTMPRAAAAKSWVVRVMCRRSSESVRQAGAEQMRREVIDAGIAGVNVDQAAPVVLLDVLIRQIRVQLGRKVASAPERELVACSFGKQRRHEVGGRRSRVVQVAGPQQHLGRVLVLAPEAE